MVLCQERNRIDRRKLDIDLELGNPGFARKKGEGAWRTSPFSEETFEMY